TYSWSNHTKKYNKQRKKETNIARKPPVVIAKIFKSKSVRTFYKLDGRESGSFRRDIKKPYQDKEGILNCCLG
ncbi:MAG TPA: hypothetical protein DCR27_01065, partial [Lachnospiraceae bacterium]|nr:hypothetical protein [Lachnospiraceae bacterium]